MTDDEDKRKSDGLELPLPRDEDEAHDSQRQAAADLIRKKIEAAYANEPSATHEAYDLAEGRDGKKSKHQKFIRELISSGKSLVEIQSAWHEYYQGLPDEQKHEVWAEFYETHSKASKRLAHEHEPRTALPTAWRPSPHRKKPTIQAGINSIKAAAASRMAPRPSRLPPQLQSLFFGLKIGIVVLVIFMFSFFNERFIAPFIQPSRNITNTPIISDSVAATNEPEILIPKINVEIPVVYGVNTIDEHSVQKALEGGVVHYADTATPGENGNVVIVGHSSNNIFNKGKYKFAFVLLSRLENGDTFYLMKDGKRYTYQVYKKQIVDPTDVSVLSPADKNATATLITCDPPGTSARRLVVVGEQISPDPSSNLARKTDNNLATQSAVIPGNAPSLWSRFVSWFTGES